MKKQSVIIAIIITAIGLAVIAPYSHAAGPTDNIPGQSQAQKDARKAAMPNGGGGNTGHGGHYHTQKTTR